MYHKKAKSMPLQLQLTLCWVQARHNFFNRWDSGFRHSPCCNFLGKDAFLTRCCWLPLWSKKKTQVTDTHYLILFSTSLYEGHWNKKIKGTSLISKGHNSSPQKKQGTIEAQVLKSDRLGLDFQLALPYSRYVVLEKLFIFWEIQFPHLKN